jgi:plasmid stabilization system protein ParE
MALRVSAEAEAELDEIWLYVATESGDADTAQRLINSITDHFFILSKRPHMGRRRDHDLRPGLRSLSVGAYTSSTASKGATCSFSTFSMAAAIQDAASAIAFAPAAFGSVPNQNKQQSKINNQPPLPPPRGEMNFPWQSE